MGWAEIQDVPDVPHRAKRQITAMCMREAILHEAVAKGRFNCERGGGEGEGRAGSAGRRSEPPDRLMGGGPLIGIIGSSWPC